MPAKILSLVFFVLLGSVLAGDKDNDGIPNDVDDCPKVAEDMDGFEDRDGCPDPDNDKDGVLDVNDKCLNNPEDLDKFEDSDGCPDLDNDKEGIPDSKDKCPLEKEDFDGFEDIDGCPDLDNDQDKISDAQDKCLNDPEDIDGFEDSDGCPDPDNDKDGISDTRDKCPSEPENYNDFKDEDGCSDIAVNPLLNGESYPYIKFRTGTAEFIYESYVSLDSIVLKLKIYPEHAIRFKLFLKFSKETEENLTLLAEQQTALKNYLVEKGIEEKRILLVDYSMENYTTLQGTEQDFNKVAPVSIEIEEIPAPAPTSAPVDPIQENPN